MKARDIALAWLKSTREMSDDERADMLEAMIAERVRLETQRFRFLYEQLLGQKQSIHDHWTLKYNSATDALRMLVRAMAQKNHAAEELIGSLRWALSPLSTNETRVRVAVDADAYMASVREERRVRVAVDVEAENHPNEMAQYEQRFGVDTHTSEEIAAERDTPRTVH